MNKSRKHFAMYNLSDTYFLWLRSVQCILKIVNTQKT